MEKTGFKELPPRCCGRCVFAAAAKAPDGSLITQCRYEPMKLHGFPVNTPAGPNYQMFSAFPTVGDPAAEWCRRFSLEWPQDCGQ